MNAKNGNFNWDITIRDIEESDFYDGITVQSYGNSDTIYKLVKYKNEWTYIPIGQIIGRGQNYKDSNIIKIKYSPVPINTIGEVNWIETIYSRRMNPLFIREEKLKLLGI